MDRLSTDISYEKIVKRLETKGYPTYPVGGCVRDSILGRKIKDVDLTTLARPDEIKEVFSSEKLIDIGKKFGTIKVISKGEEFEITTFRSDGKYLDGRHPDEISFSDNLIDDLKRRDFTINAMAYDKGKIIDPFSGRCDLEKKIVRAVGNPYERIEEDYLRSLRAVRFATRLGFEIDRDLKDAIRKNSTNINLISKERIRDEISKILIEDKPSRGIRLLDELDLLDKIFPELARTKGFDQHSSHHNLDVYEHSLKVLDRTESDLVTRMAALYHDVGKVDTFFLDKNGEGRFFGHQNLSEKLLEKRLKDLRFSKKFIEDTTSLVKRHMDCSNTYTKKSIRKLLRRIGEDNLRRLFNLQRADILATVHTDTSNIDLGENILEEVLMDNTPKKRSDLAINGSDLIALGYPQGKIIGDILTKIEEEIIDDILENNRDDILAFVRKMSKTLDSLTNK